MTTKALVKVVTRRATFTRAREKEAGTVYMTTSPGEKAGSEAHAEKDTAPGPETCLAREIKRSMTLDRSLVSMAMVGGPTCSRETIVILAREGPHQGEKVRFWGEKVPTCMRRQPSPSGKMTSMWIQTEEARPDGRPSMKTSETQCTKGGLPVHMMIGEALWAGGGTMSTLMTHGATVMTITAHGAPD